MCERKRHTTHHIAVLALLLYLLIGGYPQTNPDVGGYPFQSGQGVPHQIQTGGYSHPAWTGGYPHLVLIGVYPGYSSISHKGYLPPIAQMGVLPPHQQYRGIPLPSGRPPKSERMDIPPVSQLGIPPYCWVTYLLNNIEHKSQAVSVSSFSSSSQTRVKHTNRLLPDLFEFNSPWNAWFQKMWNFSRRFQAILIEVLQCASVR